MNTEKIAKYKKSLENTNIPANVKTKIEAEIKRLEELDAKQKEVSEKKEETPAPAKKTRAKRTPKSTPSRTSSPKSTTRKKPAKTTMSVAKEIRKEGESWADAQKRARIVMKEDSVKVTKKVESELDKLNKLVNRRKELRGMSGKTNLLRDAKRKALPAGKRISKEGNVYYENRANRADRGTYGKYHLAEGGGITKEEFYKKEIDSQKATEKGKVFKKYKVNVYENSFPFVEPLMTDSLVEAVNFGKKTIENQKKYRESSKDLFAEISEFTPIEKRDNVRYPYSRVAVFSEEDIKNSNFAEGGYLTDPTFGTFQNQVFAKGGSVKNERRHVNHNEDYEVRYARTRPSRTGYKGKRSFAEGGGIKPQLKKGDNVLIIGRKWFDKINGNTYHTAEVVVNGQSYGKSRMTYGYGDYYIETGKEILLKHFNLPKGMKETSPLWQLREYGVQLTTTVSSGLKRDLELGGNVGGYDLAGNLDGNFNIGQNDGVLSGVTGTQYSGLVGETGAMSSGEMFNRGGKVKKDNEYAPMVDRGNLKTIATDLTEEEAIEIAKEEQEKNPYLQVFIVFNGDSFMVKRPFSKDEELEIIKKNYEFGLITKSEYEEQIKEMFAKGGAIKNQYEGRTPEDVWNNLSVKQREHFLLDHYYSEEDEFLQQQKKWLSDEDKETIDYYSDKTWGKLSSDIKKAFTSHVKMGQYSRGGSVKNERRHVNHNEDYEVRYARTRPSRTGYKGKRSFAEGGDFQSGVYAYGGGLDSPKIYVADLEAYNNGKLVGEWLDLSDYNDADELNDAIQDLLNKWGVEEYAIHDAENLPSGMYSEYMGARDFAELYEMMDLAKENDLPLSVVQEIVSQYDTDVVEKYIGKYDSAVDFAEQEVDETGIQSFPNFERYLIISDMDKRLLAQEMADNYVDDIRTEDDGERLIGEADLDLDEYQEADEDRREEMLDEAREIVYDRYYEEWENGLDDPYYFLVEEQGIYDAESFANANFVQIDYDAIADALEYDYTFVSHDGEVYVFDIR